MGAGGRGMRGQNMALCLYHRINKSHSWHVALSKGENNNCAARRAYGRRPGWKGDASGWRGA